MWLARRHHELGRDPDCAAKPQKVLVVLTTLLMMSWSAVQLDRVEEDATARHRHPPVVVQLGADPFGQRVVPGCGTPQPGTPVDRGGLKRDDEPDTGPPVFTTERLPGSCVLVWVP